MPIFCINIQNKLEMMQIEKKEIALIQLRASAQLYNSKDYISSLNFLRIKP